MKNDILDVALQDVSMLRYSLDSINGKLKQFNNTPFDSFLLPLSLRGAASLTRSLSIRMRQTCGKELQEENFINNTYILPIVQDMLFLSEAFYGIADKMSTLSIANIEDITLALQSAERLLHDIYGALLSLTDPRDEIPLEAEGAEQEPPKEEPCVF